MKWQRIFETVPGVVFDCRFDMEIPHRLCFVGITVLHHIPKYVPFKTSTSLDHPLLVDYAFVRAVRLRR